MWLLLTAAQATVQAVTTLQRKIPEMAEGQCIIQHKGLAYWWITETCHPVMANPETELAEDCHVVNQCATVDRSEEED